MAHDRGGRNGRRRRGDFGLDPTRGGRYHPFARHRLAWGTVVVVAVVALLTASARIIATARHLSSTEALADNVPRLGRPDDGFVSSDTYRSCHPDQYHSWHRSYHRTMTQLAVGDNVIGDFENVTLGQGVWSIHLTRDGDLPDSAAILIGRTLITSRLRWAEYRVGSPSHPTENMVQPRHP